MKNNDFNYCCAEQIKGIWDINGGSMNVVNVETECICCGHYIGITQTTKKDARDFLKTHGLNKPNWLYIRKAETCLFSRRNGYVGRVIFGYSVCLRIFNYDIL